MAPALEQPFCAGGCGAAAAIDAGSFPEFQETFRNIGQAAELHVSVHNGYLPLAGWQFDPAGGTVNPAGVQDRGERRYDYYLDAGEKRPVPITAALSISLGVNINLDSRDKLAADLQKDTVRKLFHCPDQEVPLEGGSMGDGQGWEAPHEWSSYVFNEALLGRRNQPWAFPQGAISRVKQPSLVMFALDGKPRGFFTVFDMNTHYTMRDFREHVQQVPGDGPDVLDYLRHHYRANVLFLDGHVESLPLTEGGIREIGISSGIYN
jgi:prepilin-type processing-associated H-X9-DG protein